MANAEFDDEVQQLTYLLVCWTGAMSGPRYATHFHPVNTVGLQRVCGVWISPADAC